MTNILFLIETIQDSQFRCSYIRNKKHFLNLFLLIVDVFLKLWTPKNVVK